MAEAIRQSVDAVIDRSDRAAAWDRARAVVGRYASRTRDVAARHDRHLADIWSR